MNAAVVGAAPGQLPRREFHQLTIQTVRTLAAAPPPPLMALPPFQHTFSKWMHESWKTLGLVSQPLGLPCAHLFQHSCPSVEAYQSEVEELEGQLFFPSDPPLNG